MESITKLEQAQLDVPSRLVLDEVDEPQRPTSLAPAVAQDSHVGAIAVAWASLTGEQPLPEVNQLAQLSDQQVHPALVQERQGRVSK